jgi:tetratricopeptide (TPR) repeat protein
MLANVHEAIRLSETREGFMTIRLKFACSLVLASAMAASIVSAGTSDSISNGGAFQQGPGRGPITLPRDPELEKSAEHNLEVAKYYFYKRKPEKKDKEGWERLNKSIESRLLEIIDTNPSFARMDDVYFMLGELYKRIGNIDKAVDHWSRAVKETSDEKIKSEAQKRLDEAKAQKGNG